jgi:2-keto-4-pentenoate hydratase/2-oxohepta-3-ene-1,7-dioic acid hydratase in catechol pathway
MKIICIGRNYADHARELGNEVNEEPVVFLKPDTALLKNNQPFYLPDFSQDVHHEVEILYRIGKEGKNIAPKFAWKYVDGIGLGVDFTARDLQAKLKAKGLPWEISKAFNHSAVVSEFLSVDTFSNHNQITFELFVNEKLSQKGITSHMIFPLETLISYVSRFFTLKKGDVLFTGTPAGVGKVNIGDTLKGLLEGQEMFNFQVK